MKSRCATQNFLLLLALLFGFVGWSSAQADGISLESGLFSVTEDEGNWTATGIYTYLGYQVGHTDRYASTFEVLGGAPLGKADLDGGGKLRLSNFGMGYKGTYQVNQKVAFYGRINWTEVSVSTDAAATGFYAGLDDVEFDTLGLTLGIRYGIFSLGYNRSLNQEGFGPDAYGFTLGLNYGFSL